VPTIKIAISVKHPEEEKTEERFDYINRDTRRINENIYT